MHRVYTAGSLPEAWIVHHMLTEARIEAQVFNENSGGALGELPVTYPEVWIRSEGDLEQTLGLIAQYEAQGRQPETTLHCGECGESNPGNFELCWQCQESLNP